MAVRDFLRRRKPEGEASGDLGALLAGYSIEVTPRTAFGVADLATPLPAGTRVYVAHVDATPIGAMARAVRRLREDGFAVMPHVPARSVPGAAALDDWLCRYADAGAEAALVLAGGIATPRGPFASAMDLMATGAFDRHGFRRLHVAGHPEGNRDIAGDGSTRALDAALAWKQAFAERTGAQMAIVTQFAFDAGPVIAWAERLRATGIGLPIHVGVAGPAKLQTLLRYGYACGVGASLTLIHKRALDSRNLVLPYAPTEMLAGLARERGANPKTLIAQVHFFPLGGIAATAAWAAARSGPAAIARKA